MLLDIFIEVHPVSNIFIKARCAFRVCDDPSVTADLSNVQQIRTWYSNYYHEH